MAKQAQATWGGRFSAGPAGLMLRFSESAAPLKRLVSIEDVGNTALWLASDLGSAVTGEVIYVDAGMNIMGLSLDMLGQRPAVAEETGQA